MLSIPIGGRLKDEEFLKVPREHLLKIAEFLEIADIADIAGIDLADTSANPKSGPWQTHFTPRIREVFKNRYGQALIELGYEDSLNW